MAQDGVTFAGDVSINAVELIAGGSKIDIREQISFIEFYENLFSPFITGKVVLQDAQDLVTVSYTHLTLPTTPYV